MINDSLLIKYLAGEASSSQVEEVLHCLGQNSRNEEHFKSLKFIYEDQAANIPKPEMDEDWLKLQSAIEKGTQENMADNRPGFSWFFRAAAAVIILAIGTSIFFQLRNDSTTIRGASEVPIAAVLPDGSEVFLSLGSRISFSKDFNQELREVNITGEAFFSVASNPDRPFIVHTGEAKIRVTGTSFHVSTPDKHDDDVEVIVRSGKVLFYNSETFSENSFKVDLGPGDKGSYSAKLNQLNKTHDKQYKKLNIN